MKTILSLFLLFGCLFVMDAVFPYQNPCEDEKATQVKQDTEATVNLANYTALENHQVARYESGAPYDFSHDFDVTSIDDLVLSDGTVGHDVPIRGGDPFDVDRCLNCPFELTPIDDFERVRESVSKRMDSLNTYRHRSDLLEIEPNEWQSHKAPTRTIP